VDHVLRERGAPRDPECEAVGGRGVSPVQLVERATIAAREPPVEVAIPPVLDAFGLHGARLSRPIATMTCVARIVTVRMYSRSGCHLCDEARAAILEVMDATRALGPVDVSFDERRIDGDDALEREYGLRIPVVEVDGQEEFEYQVDPARLRALLAGERTA
jgi:hypothetical protein